MDAYVLQDAEPIVTDVAIIGGGITGLSAAYRLQQNAVAYTVVEQAARLGGKIATDRLDAGAFVVEHGPDSFITQKPWALQLARELGIVSRLIGTNNVPRKTHVLVKNRPVPMPDGLSLLVPGKILPFLRSPLLSVPGKLRALLDLLIPRRSGKNDETIASFVRRRLGQEMLDKVGEPLLGGIHSCDVERQSMAATFPRFIALEAAHGSLIRGTRRQMRAMASKPPSDASPFVSFKGGMAELVEALEGALTGRILTGTGVASIAQHESGYLLTLQDGRTIHAASVIVSAPAYVAAELLAPLAPAAAADLRAIRYVSTGTMTLAYRTADIGTPMEGFGLVIPQSEQRRVNALTITTTKWSHRAPDGTTLIRVFFGGSDTPETLALDDDAVQALVRDELRTMLGISAAPVWSRVYRWYHANPQYDLGHLERVTRIEQTLPDGLVVAGCAYRGVGIPDCVRQGEEAAQRVAAHVLVAAPGVAV